MIFLGVGNGVKYTIIIQLMRACLIFCFFVLQYMYKIQFITNKDGEKTDLTIYTSAAAASCSFLTHSLCARARHGNQSWTLWRWMVPACLLRRLS